MQQSGKGAGDESVRSGQALSEEQADQFADAFTPAWDTGGTDEPTHEDVVETAGGANATLVDAINPALADRVAAAVAAVTAQPAPAPAPAPAPPIVPVPVQVVAQPAAPEVPARAIPEAPQTKPLGVSKQTLIGTAPVSQQAPSSNGRAPHGEARWQEKAPSRPPPPNPAAARAKVTADPFKAGPAASSAASDDFEVVPKKSSKTFIFVIAGLAIAAGLGLFLKFALTDDTPKTPASAQAMGPAATTAEIPLPPPKVDTPPPPPAVTTAAKTEPAAPPPALLPPPHTAEAPPPAPVRAEPPPTRAAAPVREPRQPRAAAPPPPPPVAAAPPPPPAQPKTPPKPPNGGIVRDSPF